MVICTWPNCLTGEQADLLCESIELEDLGLPTGPEHLDLHCENYGTCIPRKTEF